MNKLFYILWLLIMQQSANAQYETHTAPISNVFLTKADTVAHALSLIQVKANHIWKRAGWWNCANILEATLDYQHLSGQRTAKLCRKTLLSNKNRAFVGYKSIIFDDNMWWALAWVKAYKIYGDSIYLNTAISIFEHAHTHAWNAHCGGGVQWKQYVLYKNAVTNELYLLLAARLALLQTDTIKRNYYKSIALNEWQWFKNSGMKNKDNLYNDGLDKDCHTNMGTTWTYNQGIILGGLKELYLLTEDTVYLTEARKTAYATMNLLSDSTGILTEPCLQNCNGDAVQFKGIFIRYLAEVNTLLNDGKIRGYIRYNATTAWAAAQNSQHLFTVRWQGPAIDWSGAGTGVGLDLMNAATY